MYLKRLVRVIEHLFPSGNVSGILASLDPVVKAGFVERGTQFGTYRFSHDLIRQTILDGLDRLVRNRNEDIVLVEDSRTIVERANALGM